MEHDEARLMTVYFAGLGASLAQVAPYMPHGRVTLPSGQVAVARPFNALLPHVYVGEAPDGREAQPWDACLPEDMGLDSQGWAAYLMSRAWAWGLWLRCGIASSIPVQGVASWRTDIAGPDETRHALAYARKALAHATSDGARVVLFGRSRGSAVALNVFVALTSEERRSIAFVLLEGTFLDAAAVMKTRWGHWIGSLAATLLPYVSRWRPDNRAPLLAHTSDALAGNTIPIGIVTSQADRTVHAQHARDVYHLLRDADRTGTSIHYLELKHSSHDGYALDDPDDHRAYAAFIDCLLAAR